jgi:hypothetical protein
VSRRDKQRARLAALGVSLLARLRPALEAAAHGGSDFVFNGTRFLPAGSHLALLDARADELIADADEILDLCSQLGEDAGSCVAARYLEACRARHDHEAHHRGGPARIAAALLKDLAAA